MRHRVPATAAVHLSSDKVTAPLGALLDDLLELYVEWRERAALSRAAYASWCDAPAREAELRFGVYLAALDQEESAAGGYAAIVSVLTRWVQR